MNPKYKSVVFCKNCKEISSECKDADSCACAEKCRVKAALKEAHEIRRFEINLYWRRSLYFWGFQAAFFAAYALIFDESIGGKIANSKNAMLALAPMVAAVIALLGLFVSILWFFLEKGSKAWQENWEHHIDQLEDDITGRLYKTVLAETKGGFYSVTKINQSFIIAIGLAWAFFLFLPLKPYWYPLVVFICQRLLLFVVIIATVLTAIWLVVRTKSSFPKDKHCKTPNKGIGEDEKINIYCRWKE